MFMTAFWVTCCWGFVADELIPPLHRLDTLKFLFVDGILLFLGLATLRNRFDIIAIVSFTLLSAFSTFVINHESVVIYFNGFRDFIGLLFVLPIIRYFLTSDHVSEFKSYFDKTLFIWLCLQAPCITWQFLRYGAGDWGGGTLGEGGSGITSMLIYVVSFYLISSRWDSSNYMLSLRENKWYVILLYPTFLNETKISFVLLVAYFILLLKFDRVLLLKMIYIVPLTIVLCIGAFFAYIYATGQDAGEMLSSDTYNEYLQGNDVDELVELSQLLQDGFFDDAMEADTFWAMDLPRFAKIGLSIPIVGSKASNLLFGMGIGHFKGWTTGRMTKFAEEYQWLLNGTRPEIFEIFVQLGLLGLAWLGWLLAKITFYGASKYPLHKQIRILISLCWILIMIYNDSLRDVFECIVFFYILMVLKTFGKADDKTIL